MTRVIATTDGGAIITLIGFVVASYIAIAIMFMVHGLIIAMMGVNVGNTFRRCGGADFRVCDEFRCDDSADDSRAD